MKRSHTLSNNTECELVYTDINTGLSDEEVLEREKAGFVNTPPPTTSKTIRQIISTNIFTYFN